MKSLNDIQTMYFIGAGGIGMSNLVRYFLAEGKTVGGYDRVESALTRELNAGGAQIHYWDDVNMIPEAFKNQSDDKHSCKYNFKYCRGKPPNKI